MTLAVGRLITARPRQHLGTVFAVSRHLALTCFHCVQDLSTERGVTSGVRCLWSHETSDAVVEAWDEGSDVALLRLSRPLPTSVYPLCLKNDAASHDQFVAPGAPDAMTELKLSAVSGLVTWPDARMPDGSRGIELLCWQAIAGLSLHGLSGAPVLTGDRDGAIGMIRWNPQHAEHPELAAGATVYAVPADRILQLWPNLLRPSTCRS